MEVARKTSGTASEFQEPPIPMEEEIIPFFEQKIVQRVIVWGGLFLLWEIVGIIVGDFYIPRFTAVLIGVGKTFTNGDILTFMGSLRQMFVGYGLAAIVGIIVGVIIGSNKYADYILSIYVNALFVTSLEALLPFLIILFGVHFKFRVAVVFLFALFYIIINTAAGVRTVGADMKETAAAFCTPRLKFFISIVIPAALPYIIAGLRLGLGHAVKGMIIAELWVTIDTGKRLVDLGYARKLPEFFALALVIVITGALFAQLLLWLQKWAAPWAGDISGYGALRDQ